MSRLLISEPPLQVLRSLAVRVGLNEAIVLQQLHYLGLRAEGRWVRKTADELVVIFPFWASATIRRVVDNLVAVSLLERRAVPTSKGKVNEFRVSVERVEGLLNLAGTSAQSEQEALLKGENRGTEDPPPNPRRGNSSRKRILSSAEEAVGFSEWLTYHADKTGRAVPRAGTSYRSDLARSFAALLEEGYSAEDFELATDGVLADDFMVANGHTKPENVLRKGKIGGRVEDGLRARAAAASDKYARFES
jgi:hypothetical protein